MTTERSYTTLSEAFRQLPPDMLLVSRVDGRKRTAAEWASDVREVDEYEGWYVGESKQDYGRVTLATVCERTVGFLFQEVR